MPSPTRHIIDRTCLLNIVGQRLRRAVLLTAIGWSDSKSDLLSPQLFEKIRSHFHAYYQDAVAIYGIAPIELIAGSLPRRQQRLVEAWAELHQAELLANWQRLQAGRQPLKIAPLI